MPLLLKLLEIGVLLGLLHLLDQGPPFSFDLLLLLDDVVQDFGFLLTARFICQEGPLDVVDGWLGMLQQVA